MTGDAKVVTIVVWGAAVIGDSGVNTVVSRDVGGAIVGTVVAI